MVKARGSSRHLSYLAALELSVAAAFWGCVIASPLSVATFAIVIATSSSTEFTMDIMGFMGFATIMAFIAALIPSTVVSVLIGAPFIWSSQEYAQTHRLLLLGLSIVLGSILSLAIVLVGIKSIAKELAISLTVVEFGVSVAVMHVVMLWRHHRC